MARDITKWDDTPMSLQHFAESAIRAYKIAMTPPMMPVILVADAKLAEDPVPPNAKLHIPKLTLPTPPAGDSAVVQEMARLLVAAEYPVIRVDDVVTRTQKGIQLLVELAETLQAPVHGGNFPSRHPLNVGGVGNADLILGLELQDFYGTVNSLRDQLYR